MTGGLSANSSASSPGGGVSKSPLDVLEEILGDAKGAAQAAQAQNSAQEQEKLELEQQAALEAEREQQRAEDAEKLREQMQALQEIHSMPQEQARSEQNQAVEDKKDSEEAANEGFEIVQLGHTKL